MTKLALRNLWGRKLRTILTGFAIVLGVATISGTYVLTDSISGRFRLDLHRDLSWHGRGHHRQVGFRHLERLRRPGPAFDESLLTKVRGLSGVGGAVGGVGGEAQRSASNGKVIQFGGAPNIGFSIDPSQPRFNSIVLKQGAGRARTGRDRQLHGHEKHIAPGETYPRAGRDGRNADAGVGTGRISSKVNIGGATLCGFRSSDRAASLQQSGKAGPDSCGREAGVSQPELISQIRSILPPQTQVGSGDNQARRTRRTRRAS